MNMKQRDAFDVLVKYSTLLSFPFDSSSQMMEDALKKIGVVSSVKLYYEYKYPHGYDARWYEQIVQRYWYVLATNFEKQILDTEKYYSDLYDRSILTDIPIDDINKKQYDDFLAKMMARCKREYAAVKECLSGFSDDEKHELINHIKSLEPKYADDLIRGVELMKTLNPELKSVRVNLENIYRVLDFHQGATYGFAPEDLDYFLNADIETRNKETEKIYAQLESFGVRPSYFIRPDRVQKILDTVLLACNIQKTKEARSNG